MSAPNFLIVGERRSGTTTLARWIEAHPQIYLHPRMDMAYFLDKEIVGAMTWKDGSAAYGKWDTEHSKVEYETKFQAESSHLAIGEKSADYLFWEHSHKRIKCFYPDIKLVITVRNPIERAWSMYWNEFGKGRETLSFEEAIKQENARIEKSDYARAHLSYLARGYYARSIKNLLKHFDRSQVHIVVLEDSIANPKKALHDLYEFLEVDSSIGFENVNKKFNKNWALVQKKFIATNSLLSKVEQKIFMATNLFAKIVFRRNIYKRRNLVSILSKPFRKGKEDHRMSDEVRKDLNDHFAVPNRELEELLNIKLKWS